MKFKSKIAPKQGSIFQKYAAYYDLLYAQKNYAAEVDYLCVLLDKHSLSKTSLHVLDLGCGTGRHAYHFYKKGFQVQGFDLSPQMIQLAEQTYTTSANGSGDCQSFIDEKKKGDTEQVSTPPRFFIGDVRSFRLKNWEQKFDLVSSLFHVASYQNSKEDLGALFETAAYHLKKGGSFLFDFWHAPGVLKDPPVLRVKRMLDQNTQLVRIAEPICKKEEGLVIVNYDIFLKKRKESLWDNFQESHNMRYWFCEEIEAMLKAHGFTEITFYAWMQWEKPDENSWYALAHCQKL